MGGSLAPGISALQSEMNEASMLFSKQHTTMKARTNSTSSGKSLVDTSPSSGSVGGMTEEFAISLVLPLYYTKVPLTNEEVESATFAWKSIVNNRSPYFQALKKQKLEAGEPFPHQICSEYFAELFYKRLFDVHPHSRGLFQNSKMKMRLYFMSSISAIIDALVDDQDRFVSSLKNMAKVHNRIGVKAVECKSNTKPVAVLFSYDLSRIDGIGCETLMFCIKKCIGFDAYTSKVAQGFNKVFSRVLDVILPIVVRHEIECARNIQESGATESRFVRVISTDSNAPYLMSASSSTASLTGIALGGGGGSGGGAGGCPMHNLSQQQGVRGAMSHHLHNHGNMNNNGTLPNSLENIQEECILNAQEV